MRDFIKRLVIVGIMALFISLLFIGGKQPQAATTDIEDAATHWMWPTDGVVTDTYGTRNGRHHGMDIAAGLGTAIYSVDEGVVSKSYYSNSYGNVVFIKHPNNLESVYAHLSKRKVKEGQKVSQGDIIGEMGSTGRSSGVHLHFEVHEHEWTVNKENSFNPESILGKLAVGDTVHAMTREREAGQVAGVMETASDKVKEHNNDDLSRYLPHSDYKILEDSKVVQTGASEGSMNETKKNEDTEVAVSNVEEDNVIYVVKQGDSLWEIAEKYETTVNTIMSTNKLENEVIVPEQELIIEEIETNKYVVQPGDTLSAIAKETNTTVEKLIEINDLSSEILHPQQVLTIRK